MIKREVSGIAEGAREKSQSIQNRLTTWSPPLIWSAVIFYFSSLPGTSFDLPPFKFVDKLIHVIVFGILNLLVLRVGRGATDKKKAFYFGTVYSILYGLSDEIHQFFIPGRFADPYDFLANVIGIVIGALIFKRFSDRSEGARGNVTV